jgi:hypothetical protein
LNQASKRYSRGNHEGILSAVSVGFFLILIGALFITTPNLFDNAVKFLSNFKTTQVGTTNIYIPAPENLGGYIDVYLAARQFSLVWGVFLIVTAGARFILGSRLRRKAENIGDIVFWLGATYLVQTFLVVPTQTLVIDATKWFEFWATVIVLIGVSLIARAIFLLLARARNM